MKRFSLKNMKGGWLVGDFEPSIFKNRDFEVGVKYYSAGDRDSRHVHRETWEITIIVEGKARMAGYILHKKDIILLEPGDESSFEALENCALTVIKYPSIPSDKFILKN